MHDWHPEDIKAAVRKRGGTLASIARDAGVHKQLLSMCIQSRVSERGDKIIAKFLDVPPHTIWPSRYDSKARRLKFGAPAAPEKAAA